MTSPKIVTCPTISITSEPYLEAVEAPRYYTGGFLGDRKRREVLSRKFTRGKRHAHYSLEEGEAFNTKRGGGRKWFVETPPAK